MREDPKAQGAAGAARRGGKKMARCIDFRCITTKEKPYCHVWTMYVQVW